MTGGTKQHYKAEKAFRFNFLVLTYLMTQLDENGMGRFMLEFDAKRIVAIRKVSESEPTINLVNSDVLTG